MNEFLRTGHYIGGEWYESATSYPVLNPATGEVIAQVAKGGAAETTQAVADAERAHSVVWRRAELTDDSAGGAGTGVNHAQRQRHQAFR